MKLQKIRYFLISLGFFWIFCATIFGSLLGAKINSALSHHVEEGFAFGLQKMLLVSVHSHLNLMGIITLIIACILGFVWGRVSAVWINSLVVCQIIATPMFVFGLLLKAFLLPGFLAMFLISIGAITYILSIALLVGIFFFLFMEEG